MEVLGKIENTKLISISLDFNLLCFSVYNSSICNMITNLDRSNNYIENFSLNSNGRIIDANNTLNYYE